MTEEEYENRRRRLEADIADAKKAYNAARARFDDLCDELRNLRIDWQEQQKKIHAKPAPTAEPAGLVIKTSAYPSRIKGPRSPLVHVADYGRGSLDLVTGCGQRKNEEAVDHLDEETPITCPRCQRAVANG